MRKKKIVAFVPIKLNSQRLPNKNILPLAGHPLCWHILDSLLKVKEIDEVYVFCSEEKVKEYIPNKVKFLKRDKLLDEDLVKGFDIYDSFIREINADIYVLAHTTSPFVRPETIELTIGKMIDGNYDSAFSAQKIQTFAWYNDEPINYDINDVPRTQDIKPVFIETSGFFMFNKEIFTEHRRRIGFKPYIQEVDNIESIDIDTREDYEFALLISENMMGN